MRSSDDYLSRIRVLEAENRRLQAELERSRAERLTLEAGYEKKEFFLYKIIQSLHTAENQWKALMRGTAATTGQDFFPALVRHIAEGLTVDSVLVTKRVDDKLHTLACWINGSLQPNFAYSLAQTPCERTLQDGIFYCPGSVQQAFPHDVELVTLEAESYLGVALYDVDGNAIGDICIIHQQPLQDPQRAGQMLRVVAARAAAELERQRANISLEQLNYALESNVRERTAALQERQQFLRTLLDTFSLAIFWKDRDSVYLGCNQNFMKDAGLASMTDIIGKTDYDMPWKETHAAAYCAHDREVMSSNTAKVGIIETQLRWDGSVIWLETNKFPLYNAAGEVTGILGTYQDITARKQTEDDLRRYERIVSATTDGIALLDCNYKYKVVNQVYLERTGRAYDEIVGLAVWDLHGETVFTSLIKPKVDRSLAGEVVQYEDWFNFAGVGRRFVSVNYAPYREMDGTISGILVSTHDITERKQLEQTLQQTTQQLQAFLDNAPAVISLFNAKGRYLRVNPAFANQLGVPESSIVGRTVADLFPEAVTQVFQARMQTLLDTRQPLQIENDLTIDGEVRTFQSILFPVYSHQEVPDTFGAIATDITERKQAEQVSRLLASVVESSNDAIITKNLDGIITSWNAAAVNLFGYGEIEAIGQPISILFPPDQVEHLNQLKTILDRVKTGQPVDHYETVRLHKNGTSLQVAVTTSPLKDSAGHLFGISTIVRDTTALKQAQYQLQQLNQALEAKVEERTVALKERETRYRALMDGASDAIILIDQVGNLIEVNHRAETLLGYTRTELTSMHLHQLHRAEDASNVMVAFQKIIHQQLSQIFDAEFLRKDGYMVPVDISASVIEVQGEIIIQEILRDISDRKEAELERQLLIQELSDFKIALDQSAIVAITDNQGIITYVNNRFCEASGYTQDELIGQTHAVIKSGYHPPSFFHDMWKTITSGKIWRGEICNRNKNGCWYWVASTIVPFLGTDGCIYQYLAIRIDITARKQAETQLQQTNQELARATRLKDEFLANMSHELRTPLNAVLGMTEGLQEEVFGRVNQSQSRALQTIERSGSHLLELINDILDVAKIETGHMELNLSPTPVSTLCRSSMSFVRQQALNKQIQLEMRLSEQLPDLWVDERRIRQVLINLLNNAVKFTSNGGRITLEVVYSEQFTDDGLSQDTLRISVIDTGIGIASEHLDRLFQPFVQIDSALNRTYDGTGLGLALVQRIVALHQGQVEVKSKVNVGSRFTIELPCAASLPSSPALINQQEAALEKRHIAPDTSSLILLAEDNEVNISTISSYLKAKGYRIMVAKSGRDAISAAQRQNPDLILMDIQMPGMDGLEAMQQIRLNATLADIPIIALTALAMPGDRERCLAAGADEYLSKPVKLKQLATNIQQLLAL